MATEKATVSEAEHAAETNHRIVAALATLQAERATVRIRGPLPVPFLREDDKGTIRIRNTRMPLEQVVNAYLDGVSAETIVRQFKSLDLADVYGVIGYYMTHREEVDEYRRRQEEAGQEVQRRIEAAQGPLPADLQELLARAGLEAGNASTGQ